MLFNKTSDYLGKSKALTMSYDVDMKVELFKVGDEGEELLETFELDDLKSMYKSEIESREKRAKEDKDKKKKKASKDKNETEPAKEEETEEPDAPIVVEKPKLKLSIELSRSGLLKVSKANVGGMYVNYKKVPKAVMMNQDQKKEARKRLAYF